MKLVPLNSIPEILLMLFWSQTVRSNIVEKVYGSRSVYAQPSVTIVPGGDGDGIIKIREGDDIVLHCRATGHPKPRIKWTIVGGHLENRGIDTNKPEITIINIRRNEGGRFSCRADNGIGSAQFSVVRLDVIYLSPPNIRLYRSKSTAVATNSMWFENTVTIKCETRSNPKSTVTWYKDGRPIKPGLAKAERIETRELAGYGSEISVYLLKIISASERHHGMYECKSSLKATGRRYNISDTKAAFNFNRNTAAPDIAILNPEKVIANPGQDIVLDCMILNGFPKPDVVWIHGSEILRSSSYTNNKTLSVLLELQPGDAGLYICAANNYVGNPVRKVVRIIVRYIHPMKYWITPDSLSDDRKLELQRDITLTCHADAQPSEELRYSWFKKNQNGVYVEIRYGNIPNNVFIKDLTIPEFRRFLTFPAYSSRLYIRNARPANYGTYQCRANLINGNNGTDVESTIVITVDSAPARVFAQDESVIAVEGSVARLSCKIVGWPKPQLQWVRDGNVTIDDERVKIARDGSLIVLNVSRDDEDTYTCIPARVNGFSKLAKTDKHDEVYLEVKFPPDVFPSHLVIREKINASLRLSCSVMYAKPDRGIKYIWMKDGRIFSETSVGQTKLSPLERNDFGLYECIVSNDAGSSRCQINVTGAARAPEFYYGLEEPMMQNEGSFKNTSGNLTYLLSWTQKNPKEVDEVNEYRIRWKKFSANGQNKTYEWNEDTKFIDGFISSGELITYSLRNLEEVEYEVEITPKTIFGLGDSASRRIMARSTRLPGTTFQGSSFSCQFSTPDLCGFTQDPSRRGSQNAGIRSTGNDFDWTLNSASTLIKRTSNTGPKSDHSTSSEIGGYMYIESSNTNKGDTARLASPLIPYQIKSTQCLRFFYHMWGRDIGRLNVILRNGTERIIWSKQGQQGNEWIPALVTLSPTASYQIVFEAVILKMRDFSYMGDIAIDDVMLENGPCPTPPSILAEAENNISSGNGGFVPPPSLLMIRNWLQDLTSQTTSLWTSLIDLIVLRLVMILHCQLGNFLDLR